jgi:uncharacterized membrane protein
MLTSTDYIFLVAILLLGIIYLVIRNVHAGLVTHKKDSGEEEVQTKLQNMLAEEVRDSRNIVLYAVCAFILLYFAYRFSLSTGLGAHVHEWLNLVVRWAHVLFGIAWIGASFYFIFLENSLNRSEGLRPDIAGNLWAIHGGGFYYVEKYKVAPGQLPNKLHWFKYEAYFTWLTGIFLMAIVYYSDAKSFLINESILKQSVSQAITISICTIIGSWLLYDLLCKSALQHHKKLFAATGFILLVAISWFLSSVFDGRAAFIHVGALLGTIMVGNVFFIIIPSQKALVRAAIEGKPLDANLGKNAGLRSLHNNYITLPVVFIMISNHFPSTFASGNNWAILTGISLAGAGARHFINLHEKGKNLNWLIPAVGIALISLMVVTAPQKRKSAKDLPSVSFSQIQPIIKLRCSPCHAAHPTDATQLTAPNGIVYDTPEQIKKLADRILVRVVETKTMPQGNKTGITEKERELIGIWIEQGANIQ